MKLFITFTKRSLAVILLTVIIVIIVAGELLSVKSKGLDGSTNQNRLNYIISLGYQVDDTPLTVKNIIIPYKFSDVYEKYNSIQALAGFNLDHFKGKEAQIYTYSYNDETVINIIISNNEIIGGDISSVSIDGEMKPLVERK